MDVAERFRDRPRLALLESARPGGSARWSYLTADPLAEAIGADPGPDPFLAARALLSRVDGGPSAPGAAPRPGVRAGAMVGHHGATPPPFLGGLIGYLGYGLRRRLEPRLARHLDETPLPDLWFGLYDWVIAWDQRTGVAWLGGRAVDGDAERLAERLAMVRARLADLPGPPSAGNRRLEARTTSAATAAGADTPADSPTAEVPPEPLHWFVPSLDRSAYEAGVERVRASIAAGDVYQVNLTRRLATPFAGDPWPLYRQLRLGDPAVNAAYLSLGGRGREPTGADWGTQPATGEPGPRAIVSASPEGFLEADSSGHVWARPIKGTRPRGRDREADRCLAGELLGSAKDRAENVMIVDVLRNDLGRVCRIGSVTVPRLCRLERTDAVQHLVTTIRGRLRPGIGPFDLLAAAFPGGSITGAPKIRAMELIDELEPVARGPYTGALGWIGPDGALSTSILIRTFVADGRELSLHVGGGITWHSDPAAEFDETVAKARGALRSIGGREVGVDPEARGWPA